MCLCVVVAVDDDGARDRKFAATGGAARARQLGWRPSQEGERRRGIRGAPYESAALTSTTARGAWWRRVGRIRAASSDRSASPAASSAPPATRAVAPRRWSVNSSASGGLVDGQACRRRSRSAGAGVTGAALLPAPCRGRAWRGRTTRRDADDDHNPAAATTATATPQAAAADGEPGRSLTAEDAAPTAAEEDASKGALGAFHRWLMAEVEAGNISRREEVSMVPPRVLDVPPGRVPTCARARGRGAAAHRGHRAAGGRRRRRRERLVIANDAEYRRCLLRRAGARLHSPALLVTLRQRTGAGHRSARRAPRAPARTALRPRALRCRARAQHVAQGASNCGAVGAAPPAASTACSSTSSTGLQLSWLAAASCTRRARP